MAVTNFIADQLTSTIKTMGRIAANSLYPNEVEYYMVSFELTDSKYNTKDFFTFPIVPEEINESISNIVNIGKTVGGVSVISSTTFNPVDITMSGTFGRSVKFLVGREKFDGVGLYYGDKSLQTYQPKEFSKVFKTGFGCTKVLEDIFNKSRFLDGDGNPNNLFFYNLISGNSYLVKVMNFTINQSRGSNNMYWNYQLTMKAISPMNGLVGKDIQSGLTSTLSNGVVTKSFNKLRNDLTTQSGIGLSKLLDVNINLGKDRKDSISKLNNTKSRSQI